MKPRQQIISGSAPVAGAVRRASRRTGILLIECIVYMAIFFILSGVAMATFYFCWDHSKALIYATDDISAAVHAGERWRADIRAARGKISVETTATNETVKIPEGKTEIIYRFNSGEVRRQTGVEIFLLLPKVKSSEMKMENRGGVSAWRWELEMVQRRKETHLPLLFTFEAAQPK